MMGGANNSIITYSSKYWVAAILSVIMVVFTFVLNFVLIPRYGVQGAAISTALSWGGYAAIRVLMVWKKYGFQPYTLDTAKNIAIIIICLLIHFVLPVTGNAFVNIILHGSITAMVYLLLVYRLKLAPELNEYLGNCF
jgi:hypothetical protein